jgi:hypothetical protein
MPRVFVVPLLLALALQSVSASGCAPTTSATEVDTDPLDLGLAPRYYFFREPCPDASPPNDHCIVWGATGVPYVYEESNGIGGLQREDEYVDDTCGGIIRGDTIVF